MRRLQLLQSRREEIRVDVPPDGVLVKEALAGDNGALETLFRRHRNSAYRLSCRLVGWTDADDLLQDCFVDVFGSLHRLRDHDAFSGWLSAIVVRTAHKRLRRRRLLERLGLRRRWPIDVELLLAPSAPPEALAEIRELYTALGALPAETQIAFLLRRVEGLSLDEIATKMSRSLATVKRRLVQADVFLKEKLERDPEKGTA